jgi:hypothetical protein
MDAGDLSRASELLDIAGPQIPDEDRTPQAHELRLTLLLERGTIAQHRCELDHSEQLAADGVELAAETFGSGIQEGRARVRLHYVWEAKRSYTQAQQANFALAEELQKHVGSEALRLSCLTRALACGVKNADRQVQRRATEAAAILTAPTTRQVTGPGGLDEREAREILGHYYLWCGFAELRLYSLAKARRLLRLADQVASPTGDPTWRWRILMQFALANMHLLTAGMEDQGRELLKVTREEADRHGYRYLVQSNRDAFGHLG